MPREGELIIKLKQAKGIRGDEAFGLGKADLFANLCLGGEKLQSKVIADGGSDAVWNEEFSFKIAGYVNFALYHFLKIFIYDQDFCGDSRRGTCKIDLKNLLEEHEDNVPEKEYPVIFHGEQRGNLIISFTFKPAEIKPSTSRRKSDLSGAPKAKKHEESAFDQLMHKIQHMGNIHHHITHTEPNHPGSGGSSHVGKAEEKEEKVDPVEKKKRNEEDKVHKEWSSESESECGSDCGSDGSYTSG